MENKQITLLSIVLLKERIHWSRMGILWYEIGKDIGARFIAFPIIVILISISHYAFAFMHTAFETVLFFINKEQFKMNMKNVHRTSIEKLNQNKEKTITFSEVKLNLPEPVQVFSAAGRIK